MTTKYIIIHASKMIKAPVGYDDEGENAKPWASLTHENKIRLCHDEITDLNSDDWDTITYTDIDPKNNPNPENIKEKNNHAHHNPSATGN